ncbi:hypothetical protein HEQ62_09360 [Haematospirillum jordaniae]|uniref:Uncharacterized protein n=1 Tax=Haematospirillum jordaniae TaxID=1549855 RepID=A0A143DCU1_9PROT|nr:hypothetical protein [Haematospirillum jordaniae]AMW34554.1 hypothetical protein AY555_04455 [Haematospirillum jordaniae]NKD44879.1 hypothetical protein [Haematospirillum jordaniae]NKD57904.1 hypothetical protein [Haematospirillum jordaniae]NKD59984.1 hypothetical protein [Haematospirillum jordaniae]NKD67922.1 hypothetical protein [Haematospirillum jordaniae]
MSLSDVEEKPAVCPNDESLQTLVQVASLEEYKTLFAGDLTDVQREAHTQHLSCQHGNALDGTDDNGCLARLSNFVYGAGKLAPHDKAFAKKIFPVQASKIAVEDMTVTTDIVYGPAAAPVLLNVGTLTFAGGSITALNTVLTINARKVAFRRGTGTKPYHIGILGTDGVTGMDGAHGDTPSNQAASGKDVQPASPGICTGVGPGGLGSNGSNGGDGQDGNIGGTGRPSLQANVTFYEFDNPAGEKLVVFTRSGAGGAGGRGGDGGAGQQGGNGGCGCDSGCEGTDGGDGGRGGNGGDGGNGGQGGNAVDGGDVFIKVPAEAVSSVVRIADLAHVGIGGAGGLGGAGGRAGNGGAGGKHSSKGAGGARGNNGKPGQPGKEGIRQGNPGNIYINSL